MPAEHRTELVILNQIVPLVSLIQAGDQILVEGKEISEDLFSRLSRNYLELRPQRYSVLIGIKVFKIADDSLVYRADFPVWLLEGRWSNRSYSRYINGGYQPAETIIHDKSWYLKFAKVVDDIDFPELAAPLPRLIDET